jgi:hypothetical protein
VSVRRTIDLGCYGLAAIPVWQRTTSSVVTARVRNVPPLSPDAPWGGTPGMLYMVRPSTQWVTIALYTLPSFSQPCASREAFAEVSVHDGGSGLLPELELEHPTPATSTAGNEHCAEDKTSHSATLP